MMNLSMIKPTGPWTYTTSNGDVEKGEYRDGMKTGENTSPHTSSSGLWTLTNIDDIVEIQGEYSANIRTGRSRDMHDIPQEIGFSGTTFARKRRDTSRAKGTVLWSVTLH